MGGAERQKSMQSENINKTMHSKKLIDKDNLQNDIELTCYGTENIQAGDVVMDADNIVSSDSGEAGTCGDGVSSSPTIIVTEPQNISHDEHILDNQSDPPDPQQTTQHVIVYNSMPKPENTSIDFKKNDLSHNASVESSTNDNGRQIEGAPEDKNSDVDRMSSCNDLRQVDHDPPRGLWDHPAEFVLSCLGYTVGIGAVWRFPYLMSQHGGGAFLLPYFLFVMILGIPLLYLEMCLGQFVSQGPTEIWLLAPLFGGIGYAMVAVCILVCCYNSVFMSWLLHYMFTSMSDTLPWTQCTNSWNTPDCCEYRYYIQNCTNLYPATFMENSTCYICSTQVIDGNSSVYDMLQNKECSQNLTVFGFNNSTNDSRPMLKLVNSTTESPEQQYFHNSVLGLTTGAGDVGMVQWQLFLCLLLAWIIIFMCVCKGVKSLGKAASVSTLAPYLILIGLLVKCCMLDGAREGILHYLQPRWYRLNDVQVWKDAAVQVLLSLGPSYGGIISLASYNAFTYNFYRAATTVPLWSCLSGILAGCLVYSSIGHLAWKTAAPIPHLSTHGWRLAFVTYPEAVCRDNPVLAGFFYLMLILMCLATVLPSVLCVITSVLDTHHLYTRGHHLTVVAVAVCGVMAVCSIPLTTQGGVYMIQIIEVYGSTWCVYIIGILECLVITWVYKFCTLQNNIWVMIGKRPGKWWLLMWGVLTPLLLLTLLLYSIAVYVPLSYNGQLMSWASNVSSWVLASAVMMIIPVYGVYAVISSSGNCLQRMKQAVRPPKKWGPSGTFAAFLSHQVWTVPDYMVSPEEQIHHPIAWKRQHSIATTSDGELESVSTMEGVQILPPGVQKGDDIDTGSIQWSEDENKLRGNWTGRFDFIFSALGYSVGVGNVWRFPYVVYKNGGGAFFVPYLIMMVFCGIPLFYMELALGQYASVGPITIWRVSPLFKGVGYAAIVTLALVCLYYNVFTAWSIYYIAASMTSDLPWATCNNSWNTEDCRERSYYIQTNCRENEEVYDTTQVTPLNKTFNLTWNNSDLSWNESMDTSTVLITTIAEQVQTNISCTRTYMNHTSPSAEYFFKQVLGMSSGIDVPGKVQWHLALCLLFSWTLTFVGLIRGVKSAGKVVYVTVLLPYLILFILLIRFVTLDSDAHLDGIRYYVTPQWGRLAQAGVWGDAASQLFFSLGLCMGGLTALGSYNRFHYDCYRDAYLICCMDALTSVFSGFVIFSILGVMAREKGTDVANVVESSFALAYIVYPDAVTRLPYSTVWSVLFFVMMFMLAVDSQFLMMEAIISAIMDEFAKYLWKWRIYLILALCVAMYLLGLTFVTQGGIYLLVLVDAHVASWSPLVIGILTCIAVAWVYKLDNFRENIKCMRGQEPGWWWKFMWKLATPALLVFILMFSWIKYKPVQMDKYEYPVWAQVLGIFMSLTPILCIPIVLAVQLLTAKQKCSQTIRELSLPHEDWGPALEKHRIACYIPTTVGPEESVARITEWLTRGQAYQHEEDETFEIHKSDLARADELVPEVGTESTQVEPHRHSITDLEANTDTQPAQKELPRRSLSEGDSKLGSFGIVRQNKSPRLKNRSSGLRVTFKKQDNTGHGALHHHRKVKVIMKDAVTQTLKRLADLTTKTILSTDIASHGQDNPAFVDDSSNISHNPPSTTVAELHTKNIQLSEDVT